MLSNDVEALGPGESCEALLLTAKGRIVAPMTVFRRAPDDFLLLTEPELGDVLRTALVRSRFAAKVEIELEDHASSLVVGRETPPGGVANREFGVAAYELIDEEPPAWGEIGDDELERLRIRAGTPRFGAELDDRVLPAEAGLDRRAIDFEKGCYPGQEPIARQHYRGRVNRTLRVLRIDGDELPEYDAELTYDGKTVGRVTSAARDGDHLTVLAYVRVEVPQDAALVLGDRTASSFCSCCWDFSTSSGSVRTRPSQRRTASSSRCTRRRRCEAASTTCLASRSWPTGKWRRPPSCSTRGGSRA
jgi:folate-binding protein YgfZ